MHDIPWQTGTAEDTGAPVLCLQAHKLDEALSKYFGSAQPVTEEGECHFVAASQCIVCLLALHACTGGLGLHQISSFLSLLRKLVSSIEIDYVQNIIQEMLIVV